VIGPLLMGLARPVQIVQLGATVNELVTAACLAAHDVVLAREAQAGPREERRQWPPPSRGIAALF